MAKGSPPPFAKKAASSAKGKMNPFTSGKKAKPGVTGQPPFGPVDPGFRRGGKVGRK